MKVKSESEVTQSCLTLGDHMDCSFPGSSAHGIFQARVLEWGAIAFSVRGLEEHNMELMKVAWVVCLLFKAFIPVALLFLSLKVPQTHWFVA